jgi:hypothetical protein
MFKYYLCTAFVDGKEWNLPSTISRNRSSRDGPIAAAGKERRTSGSPLARAFFRSSFPRKREPMLNTLSMDSR